jgi:integrase/recombinase XerD
MGVPRMLSHVRAANAARLLNPKRRHRRKGLNPYNPAPDNPLHAYLDAWCDWSLAAGFSEHTMSTRRAACVRFIVWCEERSLRAPIDITRPVLERYQRTLYQYRKSNGAPLSVIAQLSLLNALVAWFRWMVREHHVLYNPAADLELPKKPKALPKTLLTIEQVEGILNQADATTALGVRNRAIMEVFYSAGIRRMELMGLKCYDVDTERGTLMIRQGKGLKDRFIPLGARACKWVDKYVSEVRAELVSGYDDQSLFLDDFGQTMSARFIGDLMRRHVEAAGIATPGACHVFRHAMATHMLENGADIRFIQAMLGHANLETTQIYTRVSMTKLKEIHEATHPARLTRERVTRVSALDARPDTKNAPQSTRSMTDGANLAATIPSASETLLAALASESEEDH